jgi:four helix bundle protein
MTPFDKLKTFHKSYELGLAVLKSSENWPKREMFGLASQARRASTSVSINIAEGSAKRGRNEFRRYLDVALGSIAETQVLLRFARDLGFMSVEEFTRLEELRDDAGRSLWRLYESTVKGQGRPRSPAC